jgi:hypothetical protein
MKTVRIKAILLSAVILYTALAQAQYYCYQSVAVGAGPWVPAGGDGLFIAESCTAPGCNMTSDWVNCYPNGTTPTYREHVFGFSWNYSNYVANTMTIPCIGGSS